MGSVDPRSLVDDADEVVDAICAEIARETGCEAGYRLEEDRQSTIRWLCVWACGRVERCGQADRVFFARAGVIYDGSPAWRVLHRYFGPPGNVPDYLAVWAALVTGEADE